LILQYAKDNNPADKDGKTGLHENVMNIMLKLSNCF
jgi:hypothetical protein